MTALFHSHANRVAPPAVRSYAAHFGLALLSMLLLAVAFPSPGWWPLAHIAFVPITLLAAWSFSTKRVFWTGYLASYAWWLVMLSWLYGVTGGGYAALAAYMAIYYPLYLILWRWIDRRFHWPAVLTVPLVFVPLEYIRGTFLEGGMAWFGLGHSQAPYQPGDATLWFIQIADLAGDWTVSFLVAMSNGFLVDLVRWRLNAQRTARSLSFAALMFATAWSGSLLWGFKETDIVKVSSEQLSSIRVAVIQTNVPQSNKMSADPKQIMSDWNRMLELTEQALAADATIELVVWPETMVPVPLNIEALDVYRRLKSQGKGGEDLYFHETISAVAAKHKVHFIVGSGAIVPQAGGGIKRYNSAFHYLPTGEQAADYYSKIDRVPFGEYIPWVDSWPWLKEMFFKYLAPAQYQSDYTLTPGPRRTVFNLTTRYNLRVTVPICFEDAFARSTLALCYDRSGKRCDLMLNLTNDGWYPGTDQGLQHVQMAVMRCIETRVPMARSVNTGVSVFIDSAGRVGPFVTGPGGEIQEIDGYAIHTMTLDPRSTVFGAVGTVPVRLLTLTMAIAATIALAQRGKMRG